MSKTRNIIIDGVPGTWHPDLQLPADSRTALDIAVPLIAEFEGFRANAYRDPVGVWTIGFGHTRGVRPGDTILRGEAGRLLEEEVEQFMQGVEELVDVSVNANQLAALTSFSYNLGLGALGNSTLLRKLNSGDYEGAADQFRRWIYAGGKVLSGLQKRRAAEAALFRKP